MRGTTRLDGWRLSVKAGDLIKLKRTATRDFNNVFLVTEWRINWIEVLGHSGWQRITDFEVINASR